jgi:predicted DNA-binding transcriptional regulator YafY
MRRTQRLFALAEHLRSRRGGVTAEQLAERFEVTIRTIYRDLDALRDAHLPVQADRGRGGGYALDRSYALPPVNFTAREAAILITAGRFLHDMRLLPFTQSLQSGLDKVRNALSRQTHAELLQLMETLRFTGVPAHPVPPEVRAAVEEAWFEGAPLRLRYHGREGPSERTVRIESVVMERSETRLNCTDLETGDLRQFLMHQVAHAQPVRGA